MKFFKPEEFVRCNPSCDISQMDSEFLDVLDSIREVAGVPMVLNCAYRSSEYDKSKGRSGNGYHTLGRAVDVRCYDSRVRALIVYSALLHRCTVGIYPSFIHIDNRPNCLLFYGK